MNIKIESDNPVVQSQLDVLKAVVPGIIDEKIAHVAVIVFGKNGERRSHIATSPSDHALNFPTELVPAYSQMEIGLSLVNTLECVLDKEQQHIPYVKEDALYLRQKLLDLASSIEKATSYPISEIE